MTYIVSCIVAENLKSDAPRVRASAAHCPVCVSGGVRGGLWAIRRCLQIRSAAKGALTTREYLEKIFT